MLILRRKQGERVCISTPAGEATVVVHRVVGGAVKLGIEAPSNFEVARDNARTGKQLEPAVWNGEGIA